MVRKQEPAAKMLSNPLFRSYSQTGSSVFRNLNHHQHTRLHTGPEMDHYPAVSVDVPVAVPDLTRQQTIYTTAEHNRL